MWLFYGEGSIKSYNFMKVAICATGSNLDSQISPVFGRAPFLLIFNLENKKLKAIPNPGAQAFRGAGVATSQIIVSEKAKVVIAGNFGPNAFAFLQMSAIKSYQALNLTVRQAIAKYEKGELKEIVAPTGSPGFPQRRGLGPGRRGRYRRKGGR
jgi:predicted Fe-Mo cluster-binding NifX family protein